MGAESPNLDRASSAEPVAQAARRRGVPTITDRCTGCGRCVAVCPPHVLWLEARGFSKIAVLHDAAGCTGCSHCALACPFSAVRMRAVAVGPLGNASF